MAAFSKDQLEVLKKETIYFELLTLTMMHQFHAEGEEEKSLAVTSIYKEILKAKNVLFN